MPYWPICPRCPNWDFVYAGKLSRIERQLHHYGSGLNAIPVLSEYRENPNDLYLLRVGHAGTMGAIANTAKTRTICIFYELAMPEPWGLLLTLPGKDLHLLLFILIPPR